MAINLRLTPEEEEELAALRTLTESQQAVADAKAAYAYTPPTAQQNALSEAIEQEAGTRSGTANWREKDTFKPNASNSIVANLASWGANKLFKTEDKKQARIDTDVKMLGHARLLRESLAAKTAADKGRVAGYGAVKDINTENRLAKSKRALETDKNKWAVAAATVEHDRGVSNAQTDRIHELEDMNSETLNNIATTQTATKTAATVAEQKQQDAIALKQADIDMTSAGIMYDEGNKAAKTASANIQTLERMAMYSDDAPEGALANLEQLFTSTLNSFGLRVGQGTAGEMIAQGAAQMLGNKITELGAKGLTDKDMEVLRTISPDMLNSKDGRDKIGRILIKLEKSRIFEQMDRFYRLDEIQQGHKGGRPSWMNQWQPQYDLHLKKRELLRRKRELEK